METEHRVDEDEAVAQAKPIPPRHYQFAFDDPEGYLDVNRAIEVSGVNLPPAELPRVTKNSIHAASPVMPGAVFSRREPQPSARE